MWCPLPPFFPPFYISCPRAEPRAVFAVGKGLSKLTGPPSWAYVDLCVSGHAHVFVCVCARPNLKQVSVISPVEAPAQRELIIHTVTLFTVKLILPSLPFSRTLGHKSSSLPKGSQIRSIKWFGGCFLKATCECQEALTHSREGNIVIIGKPCLYYSVWEVMQNQHILQQYTLGVEAY